MIISGGSRSNWKYFAKHLMKTEENERVHVAEIKGLLAQNVRDAFREINALAMGTNVTNSFYHADINPREDEHLTEEQWGQAVDALEKNLGLEGQARFVVEHEKEGRVHRHVVWSRIDLDTLKAIPDSWDYKQHQQTSRALEKEFGLEPVNGVLGPDGKRVPRRPKNYETRKGKETGITPEEVTAAVSELWHQADSGPAFAAALDEQGYVLAKGDRRDYVVVDPAGNEHSLARRIAGAKAADIRALMKDVDRDALPSVDEARAIARERAAANKDEAPEPAHSDPSDKKRGQDAPELLAEGVVEAVREAVAPSESPREAQPLPTPEPPAPAIEVPGSEPSAFDAHIKAFFAHRQASGELEQQGPSLPDALAALPPGPEPTRFDRLAQELVEAAKEVAPIAEEVAVAAVAMEPEAGQELTAFDRLTEALTHVMRTNDGQPSVADGLDSLARRSAPPPDEAPGDPVERLGREFMANMRDGPPEPFSVNSTAWPDQLTRAMRSRGGDGRSALQRSLAGLAATRHRLRGWLRDSFQRFSARFFPDHNDRNNRFER